MLLRSFLWLGAEPFANFTGFSHSGKPQISATVQDLQILDKNDQALQTMDQLLQEDSSTDDATLQAASSYDLIL